MSKDYIEFLKYLDFPMTAIIIIWLLRMMSAQNKRIYDMIQTITRFTTLLEVLGRGKDGS